MTPHTSLRTCTGQALLELAIFGSFMLMILGLLLNYGLDAEYNQQVSMEAFRQALAEATRPRATGDNIGQGSYSIVRDRHIPHPSSPFAIGTTIPVSASASVTKDFRMHETADAEAELPQIAMDINGTRRVFKTAGFVNRDVDFCAGQILDLDRCKAQCRENSSLPYCGALDAIFANVTSLGLQDGRTVATRTTGGIAKAESAERVSTTTTLNHREQITRELATRTGGVASSALQRETITSTPVQENATTTWTTPWDQ